MSLPDQQTHKPPRGNAILYRLQRALPPLCDVKRGALVWSIAMLAASLAGQWVYFAGISGKETALAAIYFVGGLFSWPFALFFARLVAIGASAPIRYGAALFSLAGCTLAMTAFVFSQQFRLKFSAWHEPIYTNTGMHQFVETTLSGVYQFAVVGSRLYFPVGIVCLFLAALWLGRRMR